MDVTEFETELVELAVRRVRTPEGAQFYGLPIGAPITQDIIDAKKAEAAASGLTPPKGAISSGSKGANHMAGTISGNAAAAKNAPKPEKPKQLKLKVQKSSISGNKHFTVGGSKYNAPNDSKLIKPLGQDGLAYVVTPDGKVHAFNAAGEIPIPDPLDKIFETKFAGDLEGDTKYEVAEFDATSASFGIEGLTVGAVLTDAEGNPQFKKTGPTDWEHVDLGVQLDEDDIKPLYDSGELLPEETPDTQASAEAFDHAEATNFADLDTADVVKALDAYPPGQKLTMGKKDPAIVTKNEDGTWTSDFAPTSPIAPSSLALAKNVLKVGVDKQEPNPLEGNPLDANDKPTLGKGDKPTAEWLKSAPPGAEMVFKSPNGGQTTWTKQDDQKWKNQNGGVGDAELMEANLKFGGDHLKITNDGTTPPQAEAPKTPTTENRTPPEPTQRSSSSLIPGEDDYTEMATPDEVESAAVGDKMLVSFDNGNMVSEYEMQSSGLWENVDDDLETLGYQTMKAMAANPGAETVYKNAKNLPPESDDEVEPRSPVSSNSVAFQPGMASVDVWNEDSEHFVFPGEQDYTSETTTEDITDAKAGDKILVAIDPDFEPDGGAPHYESSELLEKQPDGSWKSLSYPTNTINEDDLISDVLMAEGEYQGTQLYTFKGNSTKGGSALDTDVSQEAKGVNDGNEDGLAGGNAVPGGPQAVAGELQPSGDDDGPGDSGSDGSGVQLADGSTPALLNDGKSLEQDERTKELAAEGIPVAELYELDSSQAFDAFHSSISKLKENNPYHASVYVYEEGEYANMRLFLNSDGTAGVALKGDEIVSVFVHPNSKDKGSARSLISQAVAQGGKRLDAFDTILPKIYAKEGFVPVARTPWNDDYKPDGWEYDTYQNYNAGKPDVVFMVFDKNSINGDYDAENKTGYVSDYDAGTESAKSWLKLQQGFDGLEELPPGVPAGSTKIDKDTLDSVPGGAFVFEFQQGFKEAIKYEKADDSESDWNAHLPSGLSAPVKTSYLMDDASDLYLAPSEGDKEELPEWEQALLAPPEASTQKLGPMEYLDAEGNVAKKQFKPYPGAGTGKQLSSLNGLETGDIVTITVHAKSGSGVGTEQITYQLNDAGTWDNLSQPWTDPVKSGLLQQKLQHAGSWGKATLDGKADDQSGKTFKVGDPIKGVDDLDAQVPHTTLAYTKKDGSESKYVKLENGSWLTPGGGVMASIQLKGSANSGKFKVDSIPETNAPAAPTGPYAEGDVIKKYGHLRDMPDGTVITETNLAGEKTIDIEKKGGQWWSVPNGTFSKSYKMEPGEIADGILGGFLFFKNGPEAEPEASGVLDTQLYPGAPAISHKDVQDAYIALKNHTSFQVAYGLKALDDSHPLKSKEAQDALKIAALGKYPDLKPKPAVMKHLQDALGVQTMTDPFGTADADAPKVWLGSKNPKEGVQGFDGGEFSTAEIQKAVDILEAYPGKLFKSELGKKGSPLGTLNPNDLVGFDKDKIVTKQKFIDLLKTKLTTNEELLSHPPVKSMDDLKQLAVGTKLRHLQLDETFAYYTKISANQWSMDEVEDGKAVIGDFSFETSISKGKLSIESIPDSVPDYAKAPAAVQDKHVDEIDVDNFTSESVSGASVGTTLIHKTENFQAHKMEDNSWEVINTDTGQATALMTDKSVKGWLDAGTWELKQQDGPSMNAENGELIPGKYISGGKAYMVVNADGTGVYVNTKGDVQKLTAKAVKSNFDKGMNKYKGVPDNVPTPTSKTATKAKPKAVGDIADGTYFAGNPNHPKTAVYEVKGDSVKVYKPTTVEGYKVGQEVTNDWMEQASTGAAIQYKWGSKNTYTKGDDGLWYSGEDSDVAGVEQPVYYYNYKILGHGLSTEPVTLPKAKVNTLFSQGKFTDANGNSVVPEGYSGAVHFFGAQTTIPALLAVQKALKDDTFDDAKGLSTNIQAKGLFFDKKLLGDFTAKNYGEKTLENYVTSLSDSISEMTKGLDTDIPESDAASLFEWNDLGEAKLPLEVASLDYYAYDVSSTTAYIKAASKAIGDGKVIGQHYTKMDKYDKGAWASAFVAGDFKKMYALEVAAAAKDGKAHSAGYLHPGYEGNEKTNTIAWGAAVDGEVSALTDVPGEWTSQGINPSLAEIDNYLIKAQMQNPTFLSNAEKRTWMSYHRAHNKSQVDKMSASAALRKKEGQSPLSEPPVWTDDVKPAKLYDSLFDDTQFPPDWNSDQAKEFYNDQLAKAAPSGKQIQEMSQDEATAFLKKLPVGEKVLFGANEENFWEKKDGGMWQSLLYPTEKPLLTAAKLAEIPDALKYDGTHGKPESKNFANMSDSAVIDYLNDQPEGAKVFYHDTAVTKNADGSWKSGVTTKDVSAQDLANLKQFVSQTDPGGISAEDLEMLKAEWSDAHNQYGSYSAPYMAVQSYFQKKKQEADAQALIPVYTMEPNQTVKKSTHPVFNYTDQHGKKYFFKPRPNTKLDKYRSEVEHLGNQFGKLFGFSTADSKLVELDGKYGQLQADVGGVADLMNHDYSTLTPVQIADIGNEHMLDWFLDNDDTKGDNAKILPNGRIVGIDKGRAFKHFGAWKGLSGDSSMNSNAHTVYSQLFDTIRAGKLKKEDVDQAYLTIQRKADKMAKVSDQKITDMLAEGMANREQYDNAYSINGKKVPNTFEGLRDAVLDRKNKLPEQIQEMWAKVYKDAGFGDLPEKPNNPLGDVISGLDDSRLHEQVFLAEASGKTAMIGGAHVIGGTAMMWTDESADGNTNINGEMFLGPKKQKELLDYFISNATDMSSSTPQTPLGFGVYDKYGDHIIAGAKTINHHAGDKNYNEEKVNAFQTAKKNLESDRAEWSGTLQSNATVNAEPAYEFKSGTLVPMQHLPQYKLMLDHYQPQTEKILKAYETNGKTEVVNKFTPLTLSKGGEKYVHSDGSSLTKLIGADNYLYVDGNGTSKGTHPLDMDWHYVEDAQDGKGGWTSVEPAPDEKPTSGITIVKLSKTHEQNAKIVGHKKVLNGGTNVSGSSGQEYEVTLPTGEKIYFRNAAQTNTKRGQHGKLVFRADGVATAADSQAALDRIMGQLNAMGVGTDAADHNAAELTYWREMYGVLENRKHTPGSKYAKAKAKLDQKIKEIGGSEEEFLENLSEEMDSDAETLFWRELYSEFWPDEISKLIADEGYLPKFDHQNLQNAELETGKPYWERFDISLAEIYAQDRVLASATGNEPLAMVLTGGSLSAEERLRQADQFATGWSASSDQGYGSSHNIYTRVVASGYGSYNAIYDPRMMLRTRTYSFNSDNYGNLANRKTGAPSDPVHVLKNFAGGSNETMLPHMATILDGVELYAFDYAEKRNEAIQHLKKLGIETIRGLPVEDRLIMRNNMNAAIAKIKKTWQEKLTS